MSKILYIIAGANGSGKTTGVKNRVLKGGHNVPTEDIVRRYYRSRKLFENTYKHLVDEWMLFFNGDDNFELVENQNELYDEELKNIFLEGMENE